MYLYEYFSVIVWKAVGISSARRERERERERERREES